jgi:hypothetical protein
MEKQFCKLTLSDAVVSPMNLRNFDEFDEDNLKEYIETIALNLRIQKN